MSTVFVLGAGPGIGTAVARRFAREGFDVGLLARSPETLSRAASSVGSAAGSAGRVVTADADVTDEAALHAALERLVGELGVPDVLVYNAAIIQADGIGDLDAAGHRDAWAVNVVGAVSAASFLLPRMSGTFLLTGGMPEPLPQLTSLSLGKAGVRALVSLLDRQFAPDVHVATVTVCGPVAPGTAYDPDDIAEHYWALHTQPAGSWEHEVRHGDPADAAG
ncbi:NADP-dependent 3-hydroxy acid dehydrogenase YdfG [Pseudonocardia sediminis]|uniref:NADP-dependent 3-hydroxy acid dehydrogenase YdfG n=1 Tax=Pseudonocardia sediminis TaxID=1397368 RepID=A0A4Q7V5E9_PSEST|nr:SDR family NAD(P)-dependent oxidoreductase [Pseudonocardia sediminis]RZT87983.1 NADP-dependent 3-hydroxy acid dehydrogenase YdfG [Pseudonocardia sediminis]